MKPKPTPEALALAERIRRWRESANWTQKKLAEMCGVDPTTVCGWEAGKNPGSTIARIAGAFGVDVATFFRRLPEPPVAEAS